MATTLNNLGILLISKGELSGAESLLRTALQLYETRLGPGHARAAGVLRNLAEVLYRRGDRRSAEPMYVRALAQLETNLGVKHPKAVLARAGLALVRAADSSVKETEQPCSAALLEPVLMHNRLDLLSLAALTAHAQRLVREGRETPPSGSTALGLGVIYERGGWIEEAIAAYRAAAEDHWQTRDVRRHAVARRTNRS